MLHKWHRYAHEAGFCEEHGRPYLDHCDDCLEQESAPVEHEAERFFLGVEIQNGARLY